MIILIAVGTKYFSPLCYLPMRETTLNFNMVDRVMEKGYLLSVYAKSVGHTDNTKRRWKEMTNWKRKRKISLM